MAKLDPVPILGPGGAIARRLPSYEARPEQLAMASAVAHAIETPGHLMVEAGTGVGKSFAYLVPAILAAAETKKKVVVSTHTISLQEQLLAEGHAVPALGDAAGVLGGPGQGAVELHQPATARCGHGAGRHDVPAARGVRPARRDPALGRQDRRRQPLRPRLPAAARPSGRPSPSENGNCLGKKCPTPQGVLLLSGPGGGCGRPTSWSSTTRCS